MKKLLVILSMGLLMVTATGCGSKEENPGSQGSVESSSGSSTSEESSASQESSEESLPSGDESYSGTVANGYDYANGWTEEMEAIRKAVTDELGDDYWPNTQIFPDFLEMSFGLTQDMYEDYMGEMPMISVNVETIVVVKAKPDQVDAVESALNAYRDGEINQQMQYPMNVGKVQASQVEKIGNYVCFVQLGADTDAAMEQGDEAVIEQCREVNGRVIEIIRQQVQQTEE